jgi:protein ImuB
VIVLAKVDRGREIVAACCPRCALRGVSAGMTVAHARALLSQQQAIVRPYEPHEDTRTLTALARWALRFTPIVAPADPPDELLLDISGCHRLYPSEEQLLKTITTMLSRLGFSARAACAGTFGCASAVARYGTHGLAIIATGCEREAMASLPVASLHLERTSVDALREVGIERVEHLYPIPRRELTVRFGAELPRHLDRALGLAWEVIEPVRPIETPCIERVFDGPVKKLETIVLAARELAEQMAALLRSREEGVRRLDVSLDRIGIAPVGFSIMLSRASRSARHLWSMLSPRIEKVNLGYGVERITLRAAVTARVRHTQMISGHGDDDPDNAAMGSALGELIDALTQRLGPERVVCFHAVESHVPERAMRRRTIASAGDGHAADAKVTVSDRPSLLFDRPEPAEVMAMTPEGPPLRVRWRGGEHRIVSAFGPERIGREWWGRAEARGHGGTKARRRNAQNSELMPQHRDYFKVQDESGRWLWVFCARGVNRWFVHGEWA